VVYTKYISYFLYLAYNWNIGIARHVILQEIKGEKKYKIDTTGADELSGLQKKGIDISHATVYMPASYDLLEEVFEKLNLSRFGHMLDMGCGKGRALCVAAHYGVSQLTGVDFSKPLCQAAEKNLEITAARVPGIHFKIWNHDAFYFDIPLDADCIFLFNPFDATIMSGVVKNIELSLKKNKRKITIIYFNPIEKSLFRGYKELFYLERKKYLAVSVLTRD